MGIGALIPDLDREYLFVARSFIGKHQLHRALFHNVFVIGILYVVNPMLFFGAFSHSLLDMLTSATDRGVELLFPITRIVRRYRYTIEGQECDSGKGVKWWVEDPWRLLQSTSDRDLQEPQQQPWRRSYGPFKNSRIVDWGIFFGSLTFVILLGLLHGATYFSFSGFEIALFLPFLGIGVFYALGEFWRRKLVADPNRETNWYVLIILIAGIIIFLLGSVAIFRPAIPYNDGEITFVSMVSIAAGLIFSYLFNRYLKTNDMSL